MLAWLQKTNFVWIKKDVKRCVHDVSIVRYVLWGRYCMMGLSCCCFGCLPLLCPVSFFSFASRHGLSAMAYYRGQAFFTQATFFVW